MRNRSLRGREFVLLSVSLALWCLVAHPIAAQTLTIGTVGGNKNETVYVPVTFVAGATATITAFQMDVSFSSARLVPGTVAAGTALGSQVVRSSTPSTGLLRLVVYSPTNAALPAGQVAVLSFTISGTAPNGVTPLSANTGSTRFSSIGAVSLTPASITNGGVDVGGATGRADASVVKDVDNPIAVPGQPLTYTITVNNAGPDALTGATVSDVFPLELTGVSWTCVPSGAASCSAAGSGDISDHVNLPVSSSVTYVATGTLVSVISGPVTNTARVANAAGVADPSGGNNSDEAVSSPDAVPPRVLVVGSVPDTGNGSVSAGESTSASLTQLKLGFSEGVYDPAGDTASDDVTNPANFMLVEAGANGLFATTACGATQGDDVAVSIPAVVYSQPSATATVLLNGVEAIPAGRYRLLACGSTTITDLSANPLDGNADGTGGDEFTLDFTASQTNLLDNPNLDDDLQIGGWAGTGDDPGDVAWSLSDAGAADTSGSVLLQSLTGDYTTTTVSQCVQLPGPGIYAARAKGLVASSAPGDPDVLVQVKQYATTNCTGTVQSTLSSPTLSGTTSGQWSSALSLVVTVPGGVQSALVTLRSSAGAAFPYTVNLDDLVFGESSAIFTDGFESGSAAAWSVVTP